MKKLIFLFTLIAISAMSMATSTKHGQITSGFTMLSQPMKFTAADSLQGNGGFHIVTGDSLVILITNPQKFLQYQTITSVLAVNSGSGTITITARGKVTSNGTYTTIGSAGTYSTGSSPVTITATTAKNYNYIRISYVQSGGTECARVTSFDIKTVNYFPYGATLLTATAGATITGAAINLNATSNYTVNIGTGTTTGTVTIGGTGAQTIAIGNGAAAKTVALGSSNTTSTTTILSGSNAVNINASNNQPTNINTGTSTGLVTIGGGSGTVAINSSVWGISATGALTGVTTIVKKSSPAPFDSTGTITAAKMLRGTIKCASATAVTMTTPTATAIAALIPGCGQGTSFELTIDNSGSSSSGIVTLALDGSITQPPAEIITGQKTLTLAIQTVARFNIYFTSGTTAKIYRVY